MLLRLVLSIIVNNERFSSLIGDRNVSLIGIIEGIRTFAAFLPIPVFSIYALRFTSSGLLAGLAMGVYGIAMIFSQIMMGSLSDIIGRKRVSMVSSVLFSLGNLISWHPFSIQILVFSRLLAGLGAISSPLMALLNERSDMDERTSRMAFVGTLSGLGIVIGVIAGPEISTYIGIDTIFLFSAILGFISLLPILMLAEDRVTVRRRLKIKWDPSFTFSSFVSSFILFAIFFFLPIYWMSRSQILPYGSFIAISLVAAGSIGILISIKFGMLSRITAITLTLFAVSSLAMFYFSEYPYAVMSGFFIFAIGYTIFEISFIPLLIKEHGGDYGSLIGFFNGGRYAGEFAGSLTMGALIKNPIDLHGLHLLFLAIVFMITLSILLLKIRFSKYGNVFNIHN
ncbi:multidrug resistance protein related protein [Thermoplasma acidophilum]|uniref:Multidrug resistance protein related protein n=1 Tax=Thermoplasma acidophilum (strain ATCC 25905 / DSM 1728 / JCM 9062 / NBRC 15155 / AMRC-C165) TaxID=273075 RepID=Q9HKT4_THEAC|nr:multidrug resistance protein related protein [Thermoplasma acidophilum]